MPLSAAPKQAFLCGFNFQIRFFNTWQLSWRFLNTSVGQVGHFFKYVNRRYEKLINILISQKLNGSLLANVFIHITCITLLNIDKKIQKWLFWVEEKTWKINVTFYPHPKSETWNIDIVQSDLQHVPQLMNIADLCIWEQGRIVTEKGRRTCGALGQTQQFLRGANRLMHSKRLTQSQQRASRTWQPYIVPPRSHWWSMISASVIQLKLIPQFKKKTCTITEHKDTSLFSLRPLQVQWCSV